MNLIKWHYGNPVVTNFFNEALDESFWGQTKTWVPATNILSKEDGYQLELAVPGFNKEDLKLEVNKRVLTISTQKEEVKEDTAKNYTRKEFAYSSFSKSFELTDDIDESKIQANYDNGILKIALPKKEVKVEKAKEIAIS